MVDNGEICIEVPRFNNCITWIGFGFFLGFAIDEQINKSD